MVYFVLTFAYIQCFSEYTNDQKLHFCIIQKQRNYNLLKP